MVRLLFNMQEYISRLFGVSKLYSAIDIGREQTIVYLQDVSTMYYTVKGKNTLQLLEFHQKTHNISLTILTAVDNMYVVVRRHVIRHIRTAEAFYYNTTTNIYVSDRNPIEQILNKDKCSKESTT